jgi:hypothetical protein
MKMRNLSGKHPIAVPISKGLRSLFEKKVWLWARGALGGVPATLRYRLEVVRLPESGALSCEVTVQSGALLFRASDYGAELQQLVLSCLRNLHRVMAENSSAQNRLLAQERSRQKWA